MTIREAIEWFSGNFPDYVCEIGPSDKQMAYNLAIKALEQIQLNEWISVDDALPDDGKDETWVYAVNHELGIYEIDVDEWRADRGEKVTYMDPDGEHEGVASGWYMYSGWDVKYWMPINRPLPPASEVPSNDKP